MSDGYALASQKAIISALKANTDIISLVSERVYDQPPSRAQRPFIRMGGVEVRPLRSDCGKAATVTFGVEAHSRPETSGRVEATRCAEAIVNALDVSPIEISGFTLVQIHWETQSVTPDADGESYTAVVAFSAVLDG